MSEHIENYDFTDIERPSLTFQNMEKKVKKEFEKQQNPEIKPKDVFEGYKEKSKGKKKNSKK